MRAAARSAWATSSGRNAARCARSIAFPSIPPTWSPASSFSTGTTPSWRRRPRPASGSGERGLALHGEKGHEALLVRLALLALRGHLGGEPLELRQLVEEVDFGVLDPAHAFDACVGLLLVGVDLRFQGPDEPREPRARLAIGDLEHVDHLQRHGIEEKRAERLARSQEKVRAALEFAGAMLLEPVELDQETLGGEGRGFHRRDLVLDRHLLAHRRHDTARLLDHRDRAYDRLARIAEEAGEDLSDSLREGASAHRFARAHRRVAGGRGIEQPLELSSV